MTARALLQEVRAIPQEWSGGYRPYVYFIEDGTAIKIGVACWPADRLNALQVGNPRPLGLLGAMPGSRSRERFLHARYAAWNIHGEWFYGDAPGLRELALECHATYREGRAA